MSASHAPQSSPTTSPAPPPAWVQAELSNPHASAEKAGKVRRMFAAIAGSYDLNNRVHSLGRDQAWRRYAVRTAGIKPGETVLDVACGTGDLTQAFAATQASSVVGLDFTREMLDVAERKQTTQPAQAASKIRYIEGDAQQLPFPDRSFDVLSIAFGIRNVAEPRKALSEFARVLKPGGRLVILEFDTPRNPLLRWFNNVYCGTVMPRTATMISRDRSGAYRYLPASVGTFMSRDALQQAMRDAGFADVSAKALTLGICVCYRGSVK
jgi:demethylmenaquinone methyltransferase / 2-methoxy-6-polyprenyl-1,4-benzoquinol methylase